MLVWYENDRFARFKHHKWLRLEINDEDTMSEQEYILFIKIFEEGLSEDYLDKLFKELTDVDNISELGSFIEECLKNKSVKEFRDCVINKIKNAKELKEANARKLKEEQEKRILSKPKSSTFTMTRRRR